MAPEDPTRITGAAPVQAFPLDRSRCLLLVVVSLVVIPEGDLLLPLFVFAAGRLYRPARSGETPVFAFAFSSNRRGEIALLEALPYLKPSVGCGM